MGVAARSLAGIAVVGYVLIVAVGGDPAGTLGGIAAVAVIFAVLWLFGYRGGVR
jgi:hypothetical protein